MTTTVAWVDAQAGIAGDMFLGALVDAGLDPAELETVVGALGLDGVSLEVRRVQKGPLAATKVEVLVDGIPADPVSEHEGQAHGHRTLGEIEDRIRAADELPEMRARTRFGRSRIWRWRKPRCTDRRPKRCTSTRSAPPTPSWTSSARAWG